MVPTTSDLLCTWLSVCVHVKWSSRRRRSAGESASRNALWNASCARSRSAWESARHTHVETSEATTRIVAARTIAARTMEPGPDSKRILGLLLNEDTITRTQDLGGCGEPRRVPLRSRKRDAFVSFCYFLENPAPHSPATHSIHSL